MSGRRPVERPWLDSSLPVATRVALILAELTLAEKVGQLVQVISPDPVRDAQAFADAAFGSCIVASGADAGNVRDGGARAAAVGAMQAAAIGTSRVGLPLLVARDVIHGHRTVFPIPLGQAATFDPDLVRRCARAAAVEATADGVRWTFAPVLDLAHDPRWGRVAEGYGESAWLAASLGSAAVLGFQGGPDALADPESMAACAKHYIAYGLAAGGRDYAEVDVGPVALHNRHLRPFRAAVDAGVASVMSAFHSLDGTPMTAHRALLDHLHHDLGLTGPVVSDFAAVAELVEHGVATDLRAATELAVTAGVDVDMAAGGYAAHLADLVADGTVPITALDRAVARVLTLKVQLGLLDRPVPEPSRPTTADLAPDHRALARLAAARSAILLHNSGVLPLIGDGGAEPDRVHVTGPFATATGELFGTWTLDGRSEDATSIADALRHRLRGSVVTVDDARFTDATLIAARQADVVIACVGEHPARSGEGNSVTDLGLPPGQLELVRALSRVARRLVVVVLSGRPLALEPVAAVADALVLAFHPGVEGGTGLVDVLTGDAPASGRLPVTVPRVVGQVPLHHDHPATGRPLRPDGPVTRYRDLDDSPAWPVGFGLGYSPVTYGPTEASARHLGAAGPIEVRCTLVNSGTRAVLETAQLYLSVHTAATCPPVGELAGARQIELGAGERTEAVFTVTTQMFTRRDATGTPVHRPSVVSARIGPHAGGGLSARFELDPRG